MKIPFRAIVVTIITSCSIFFVQCKKEAVAADNDLGLPNATQTGANIFATALTGIGVHDTLVYISNSTFIADNDVNDPFYSTSGNGAWLNNDTLIISGAPQTGSYFKGIRFVITGNLQEGGIYPIDSVSTTAFTSTDSTCQGISLYPTTSLSDSGSIQITKLDTVNKIVSGTFTCNFMFTACDSTVYATDGRFDYKYQ